MFGRFLPFLLGMQLLRLSIGFPAHQVLSDKGSTLTRNNLLPREANSFLLEFSEGNKNNFD